MNQSALNVEGLSATVRAAIGCDASAQSAFDLLLDHLQAYSSEFLALRAAWDEKVVRLAEEYQLGETELHRMQTYKKLEGGAITLGEQLREAQAEIERLKDRNKKLQEQIDYRNPYKHLGTIKGVSLGPNSRPDWLEDKGKLNETPDDHKIEEPTLEEQLAYYERKCGEMESQISTLAADNAALLKQWNELDQRNEQRHHEWSERLLTLTAERDEAIQRYQDLDMQCAMQEKELVALKAVPGTKEVHGV